MEDQINLALLKVYFYRGYSKKATTLRPYKAFLTEEAAEDFFKKELSDMSRVADYKISNLSVSKKLAQIISANQEAKLS